MYLTSIFCLTYWFVYASLPASTLTPGVDQDSMRQNAIYHLGLFCVLMALSSLLSTGPTQEIAPTLLKKCLTGRKASTQTDHLLRLKQHS